MSVALGWKFAISFSIEPIFLIAVFIKGPPFSLLSQDNVNSHAHGHRMFLSSLLNSSLLTENQWMTCSAKRFFFPTRDLAWGQETKVMTGLGE